jgi:Flp pilus assembly pilin Flp
MHSSTGFRKSRRSVAQSMVEYAIIAALVAVVALVAIKTLGTSVSGVFDNITSSVQSVNGASSPNGHP